MYSLKPIVPLNMVQDLPTCMYRLPPIQGQLYTHSNSQDSDLAALESRQECIIHRLNDLKKQLDSIHLSDGTPQASKPNRRMDVVVKADPSFPPKSLPLICRQLQKAGLKVFTSVHVHSSLVKRLPENLHDWLPQGCPNRSEADVVVTLIWKEVGRDPECIESALASGVIRGEANVLRFFCRTFKLIGYEKSPAEATKEDYQLDAIHSNLFWGDEKLFFKNLEESIKKESFLGGRGGPNVADFLAFSALGGKKQTPPIQEWAKKCIAVFS